MEIRSSTWPSGWKRLVAGCNEQCSVEGTALADSNYWEFSPVRAILQDEISTNFAEESSDFEKNPLCRLQRF